jgi:hypothetical protein
MSSLPEPPMNPSSSNTAMPAAPDSGVEHDFQIPISGPATLSTLEYFRRSLHHGVLHPDSSINRR